VKVPGEGSPESALLFPAIANNRTRTATAQGFAASGQWVEPMRVWSDRAVTDAMTAYVHRRGTRTFHGFRAGNNRELRRHRHVSAITRRVLHDRSLKPIIGSEEAYDEPFAEDFAAATAALGQLRIEHSADGLPTVTATSASAGRIPADWVATPASAHYQLHDSTDSDDSASSASSEEGGEEYNCGRCGRLVSKHDYGWLCDFPACAWGVCTACHEGGPRSRLLCPMHAT
jgi:hypothetical protein